MVKNNQEKSTKWNKVVPILACVFFLCVIINLFYNFLAGYLYSRGALISIGGVLAFFGRLSVFGILILTIICPICSIKLIISKKRFLAFTVAWLMLVLVGFNMLHIHYLLFPEVELLSPDDVMAFVTLDVAGPDKVREEARQLISSFTPPILDERYKDAPPEIRAFYTQFNKLKKEDMPPAIKKLRPTWVRVYKDRVDIKITGLGDFAGYVITFGEKPENSIELKDNIYWVVRPRP